VGRIAQSQALARDENTGEDEFRGRTNISLCGRYRYRLGRSWSDGPIVNFIMLNPSTADSTADDPTIRRCIEFARKWDFAGIEVTNLYAFRATLPEDLWEADDPIGPENDATIDFVARNSKAVVMAWGTHGGKNNRGVQIMRRLGGLGIAANVLKWTKFGCPSHPLYLRADLVPIPVEDAPKE
jgi:hypothetical protein